MKMDQSINKLDEWKRGFHLVPFTGVSRKKTWFDFMSKTWIIFLPLYTDSVFNLMVVIRIKCLFSISLFVITLLPSNKCWFVLFSNGKEGKEKLRWDWILNTIRIKWKNGRPNCPPILFLFFCLTWSIF